MEKTGEGDHHDPNVLELFCYIVKTTPCTKDVEPECLVYDDELILSQFNGYVNKIYKTFFIMMVITVLKF